MILMAQHNKIAIYLPDSLLNELSARGDNRSGTISRDLERLYTLYNRALATVSLELNEAYLIVDALNGVLMDANNAKLLCAEIEDAIKLDHLDQKWQVDSKALVEKLRNLNEIQAMAIIDAAERFWQAQKDGKNAEELLKKIFRISGTEDKK
jgi:hypothetical protein